MNSRIILRILIFISAIAYGEISEAQLENWTYEVITPAEEDLNIIASGVDQKGMIWLSTRLGIMTFDGNRYNLHPIFQQKEIRSKVLNCRYLKFDPQGRLWILTDDRGILVYDFKLGKYWQINNSDRADIRLNEQRCGDVIFEGEFAWLVTFDHQLHRISLIDHTIVSYDAWQKITDIYPQANYGIIGSIIRKDKEFWIATRFGLLTFSSDTEQFELIKYIVTNNFETTDRYNYAMYLNGEDLFISLSFENYHGVCVFNITTNEWISCDNYDQEGAHFLSLDIRSFTKWSDSLLVAGSRRFALHLINPYTYESKSIYEEELNLKYRDFQELGTIHKVSSDMAYIVSTYYIIRMRNFKNPFTYLPIDPSGKQNHNWQRALLNTDEGAYIGTYFGDGLIYLNWNDKSFEYFPDAPNFEMNKLHLDIQSIVKRTDKRLWLASSEGMLIFDPTTKTLQKDSLIGLYTPNIPTSDLNELFFFPPHLFIRSESKGLYVFNAESKNLTHLNLSIDPKHSERFVVKDMLNMNSTTFLMATTMGMRRLTIDKNDDYIVEIPFELRKHEIADIDLNHMHRIDDIIYLSSNGDGLFSFSVENEIISQIESYFNPENISYNVIGKIVPNRNNQDLWLNTADGFSHFNRSSHVFTNYSVKEGIGFRGRNGKSFFKLNNGFILSGAHKGLHYFYPDSIENEHIAIQPYLNSVISNQKLNSVSSDKLDTLNISQDYSNLRIEMGAINYNPHPVTYYSYQLEGYDDQWSEPSISSTANFTKLPGGNYSYRYRVATSNFDWVEGKQLRIIKEKRFTEHTWFFPLILFLIFLLALGVYNWRKKRQEEKTNLEREYREKIKELEMNALRLQMNPHFIFNSINSINWFVIKNDRKNASNYLTKFSRLIRIILDNSKSSMITIEDELEAVRLYLQMEKLRFNEKFDYKIDIESHINLATILMPPMIFQPYIENAIWHGIMPKKGKGQISILLTQEDKEIKCIIQDNGIGREASKQKKKSEIIKRVSLGMKITEERLAIIKEKYNFKAKTDIRDLYNEEGHALGTKVIISLPIISKHQIAIS